MKKGKHISLVLLALFYSFIGGFFLLFSRNFLAVLTLLPRSALQAGLEIIKGIFNVGIIRNPPGFIKPFIGFLWLELPLIIVGLTIAFLFLRKRFDPVIHQKALCLSIVMLMLIGLPSLLKSNEVMGHKIPSFFSVGQGLRNTKCFFVNNDAVFNWTYPEDGRVDVSIHSPVVINFKHGIHFPNGCNVYDENGDLAGSQQKMLGGTGGQNIPIVPEGSSGIPELEYLQSANLEQIKTFVSNGSWKEKSTFKVVCSYTKNSCPGQAEFTFITGEKNDSFEPSIKKQIPVTQIPAVKPIFLKLQIATPSPELKEIKMGE